MQYPRHYSKEEETLRLTYRQLKLPLTQKAILIRDVFRGQKTEGVLSKLASLNIEI